MTANHLPYYSQPLADAVMPHCVDDSLLLQDDCTFVHAARSCMRKHPPISLRPPSLPSLFLEEAQFHELYFAQLFVVRSLVVNPVKDGMSER